MKRSEIHSNIEWALQMLEEYKYYLPEFGYWTLEDWKKHADEVGDIKRIMLGWDITDFGSGDFENIGAILFTIRNGVENHPEIGVPYAEKLFFIREGQFFPYHYHAVKTEDIINRGGGLISYYLYNSLPDGEMDKVNPITLYIDGIKRTVQPGEEIVLKPGSSLTLNKGIYHRFGAKPGHGPVIGGEVSSVNDDKTNNYWYDDMNRFQKTEEDVPAKYILCNEYNDFI